MASNDYAPLPQNSRVTPLAQRTLQLVDIPSESFHEAEIAAYVERVVPLPLAWRDGETLLYRGGATGGPLVVLAGHLDTVPAQGTCPEDRGRRRPRARVDRHEGRGRRNDRAR